MFYVHRMFKTKGFSHARHVKYCGCDCTIDGYTNTLCPYVLYGHFNRETPNNIMNL